MNEEKMLLKVTPFLVILLGYNDVSWTVTDINKAQVSRLVRGSVVDNFNGPNHELMIENDGISTKGTYEGDIILTDFDVGFLNGNIQGDAIIGEHYKWRSTTIPYELASNLNSAARNAIRQAIAEYKSKTCIRFREKRSGDTDWIHFFPGGGCWSYVGKQRGMQKVSLGNGCEYKSTAVHEILHALGFWHEQSRPDRDQYVRIHKENIMSGMESNFDKHRSSAYGHPYDYDSVMHYSNKAFSVNGRRTITARRGDPNRNFGQPWNGGLSTIDAKQVNDHYQCDGGVKTTTTTRSTTTDNPNPGCKLSTACKDNLPFCSVIARQGFCSLCWSKQNCSLSCSDPDKKKSCPTWARRGYCRGRYEKYMTKNCRKSCGLSKCKQ